MCTNVELCDIITTHRKKETHFFTKKREVNILKILEERILREGRALSESVLKVDSFINHQVDPVLMDQMGKEFADHFREKNITKVVTIESSGIAPALTAAAHLHVPMIILKKQTSKILNGDVYQTRITSFTKGTSYELTLYKDYVNENDNILLIDDFLANGEAATGGIRLVEQAGAKMAGIGIVIEKSFQRGRQRLLDAGYEVYSLARVAKLRENLVEFVEEETKE
jgi:xanthine phosphoribosyltransferase